MNGRMPGTDAISPAGQLANAYDLHIAAAAALKPLVELGERAKEYSEWRDRNRS
jgi:hypothetical protein